ncbi:hypothetical protein [Streptomyces sp. NPDC048172]|uniref:hypothetical protein n=1 Tax=Streptomyces sp. NPDC048172 TaxID=3365505 RepID=UPI0037154B18
MGFGTYARKVRDEALAPHVRHGALRCAVERYCPLGFHATWAYVTAESRPSPASSSGLRRDMAALVRALDVLEESRAVWLRDVAAYAAVRRAEKTAGHRVPRRTGAPLLAPGGRARPCWPGADGRGPSRLGMVAAVADRYAAFRAAPGALAACAALDACAAEYIATLGRPGEDTRDELGRVLRELEARPPVDTLSWVQFARLLDYAARVEAR